MADKENVLLSFSPQKLPVKRKDKKVPQSDSDSIPVLLCAPFQSTLWIGFGCVPLENTVTRIFELRNETEKPSKIRVEKWEVTSAARAGFSISFGSSRTQSVDIGAKESVIGYVSWTPSCDQSISENVILKLNERLSLQITLHGIAGTGDVSRLSHTHFIISSNVLNFFFWILFTFVVEKRNCEGKTQKEIPICRSRKETTRRQRKPTEVCFIRE